MTHKMSEFAHLASLPELTTDQEELHKDVERKFGRDIGDEARRLEAQEATKIREIEVANFGSDSAAEREAAEAEFDKDFKYKTNQAVRLSMDGIIVNGTIVGKSKSFMHPFGPMYIVEYVDTSGRLTRVVLNENELMKMQGGKNKRISKKHRKSKHRKSKHRKSKHRKSRK